MQSTKFKVSVTRKDALLTILFLFPILGNSVRSWTGVLFFLVFLLSLYVKPWRHVSLDGWERMVCVVMPVVLFSIIMLSCLLNGWTDEQTKGVAVFSRLLMFIGVYYLLKTEACGPLAFAYGCVAASFVLVLQGAHDILIVGLERAYGVYFSPGLFAGQAVVFGLVCSLFAIESSRPIQKMIFSFGVVGSVVAIVMSGSRATFFAIFVLSIFHLWSSRTKLQRLFAAAAVILFFGVGYLAVPSFSSQIDRSFKELNTYVSDPNVLTSTTHESVGTRFELWRVGLLIGKDSPYLGVGWRNFSSVTPDYVRQGLANPAVLRHRHPHNTYIEFFASSGLFGLSALILWGMALRYYTKLLVNKGFSNQSFWCGMFLGFLAAAAINEGGLFIYGNSLSFYLIALAVLLPTFHHKHCASRAHI